MTDEAGAWTEQKIVEMFARVQEGKRYQRERRERVAETVETMADGIGKLGASEKWESTAARSAARLDQRALAVNLDDRVMPVVQLLREEAAVNILSAADQLRGFATLLRAETSLMGAVSVARGVFEACLWAAAVLDPAVDSDTRVQRALTRRLARIRAGMRLTQVLNDVGEKREPTVAPDHEEVLPERQIEHIKEYAESRGWAFKKGRRAPYIEDQLSIDWLAENLEGRIGLEQYAWTTGSSMAHGEHAADTAGWMKLSQDIGSAPSWLILLWSTGAWAGPRLLLATVSDYTGFTTMAEEYRRFASIFWERKPGMM